MRLAIDKEFFETAWPGKYTPYQLLSGPLLTRVVHGLGSLHGLARRKLPNLIQKKDKTPNSL
jgi:hypothetical protein